MKANITVIRFDGSSDTILADVVDMLAAAPSLEKSDPKRFSVYHVGSGLTVAFFNNLAPALQICEKLQEWFPNAWDFTSIKDADRSALAEVKAKLESLKITIARRCRCRDCEKARN